MGVRSRPKFRWQPVFNQYSSQAPKWVETNAKVTGKDVTGYGEPLSEDENERLDAWMASLAYNPMWLRNVTPSVENRSMLRLLARREQIRRYQNHGILNKKIEGEYDGSPSRFEFLVYRERQSSVKRKSASGKRVLLVDLIEKQRGCCYLCGKLVPTAKMAIDHIIPESKGGPDSAENFAAACKSCNSSKSARFVAFDIETRTPVFFA